MTTLSWRFSTIDEVRVVQAEVVAAVTEAARRVGCYTGTFEFRLKLVLEEGLVNHVKHGNQFDPDKVVTCDVTVEPDGEGERVVIDSKDQGEGFEFEEVPDPTDPDRIEVPNGRGLLLISGFAEMLGGTAEYLEKGTRLRVSLLLTPAPATTEETAA